MSNDPWKTDRLNRRETGEHLIRLLQSRYEARKRTGIGSYTLNLDASWGQGKTFFLNCLVDDLRKRGHVVSTVNAWQDDHVNDPLVTVMAAIEDQLSPFLQSESRAKQYFKVATNALSVIVLESTKQAASYYGKKITGISGEAVLEKIKETSLADKRTTLDSEALENATEEVIKKLSEGLVTQRVAEHKLANRSSAEFREYVSKTLEYLFANNMLSPMFVIIDELDRCRPLYAIKLLEDIKHLFSIDGIVYIIATDTNQLSHSVKAIYGSEFEARKYLRRFFDQTFVFPETNRAEFIKYRLGTYGINIDETFFNTGEVKPIDIFTSWADALNMSNRDIDQCMEIVSVFIASWEHNLVQIEPIYLLCLVWSFYNYGTVNVWETPLDRQGNTQLNKWYLTQKIIKRGAVSEATVRGDQFLTKYNIIPSTPLRSIDHVELDSFYAYLYHERLKRFGAAWMHINGDLGKSVITEYASRVRHAGRILDRPQT